VLPCFLCALSERSERVFNLLKEGGGNERSNVKRLREIRIPQRFILHCGKRCQIANCNVLSFYLIELIRPDFKTVSKKLN
jgi:hypothetical protein